jgi:hypothetical protein
MTTRSVLLIVLLTLALAAPTGAAVTKLITGKQIATGAIQPRHLSVATRKLGWLHRQRVSGLVTFSYPSRDPQTARAACPQGSILLTGGFSASNDVVVSESAPPSTGGNNGWEATGRYTGGGMGVLYAYAVCAS